MPVVSLHVADYRLMPLSTGNRLIGLQAAKCGEYGKFHKEIVKGKCKKIHNLSDIINGISLISLMKGVILEPVERVLTECKVG